MLMDEEEEGTEEAEEEARRRGEGEKKFTDEERSIISGRLREDIDIIVTPDGITMHRTSEGRSSVGSVSIACNRR